MSSKQEEYRKLFNKIRKTESGSEQNLEEIERRLEHLRKGGALTYEDLETIADPQYWPFNKYWMWPHRSQIEKKLASTEGLFRDIPKDEKGEEKRIERLLTIFKNIGLVSIVLRFARPDLYAIYSFPVLQILRIERGKNAIEEYMNYIREMRILRKSFWVDDVAEVDKIILAIFYLKGPYADELKKILAKVLPENLTAQELIIYLSHNPLKIAHEYLKRKDHISAGMWAARSFEKFLNDQCREFGIFVEALSNKMSVLIKELCERTNHWKKRENKRLLYQAKDYRNVIVHDSKPFDHDDIEEFIADIDHLMKIALHKGY